MASWAKKELAKLKFYKSNKRLLLPPPPPPLNLQPSHDESSTFSQAKEVVLAADLRCETCQKRAVDAISSIDDIESMVIHVMERKITITRKSAAKASSTKVAAAHNNLAARTPSRAALFSLYI